MTRCFLLYFFVLISFLWFVFAFGHSRWHKMRLFIMFRLYWMAQTIWSGLHLCVAFLKAASCGFMWLGRLKSQLKGLLKQMRLSTLVLLIEIVIIIRFLRGSVTPLSHLFSVLFGNFDEAKGAWDMIASRYSSVDDTHKYQLLFELVLMVLLTDTRLDLWPKVLLKNMVWIMRRLLL